MGLERKEKVREHVKKKKYTKLYPMTIISSDNKN